VRPEGTLIQLLTGFNTLNEVLIDPILQKKLDGFPGASASYVVMGYRKQIFTNPP